jgi:hypothetical protein
MKRHSRHHFLLVIVASLSCYGQNCLARSNSAERAATITPDSNEPVSERPQIVRVQRLEMRNGVKYVNVGNSAGDFSLACSQSQDSCITPVSGVDYFLFTKETRWKFSGAKDVVTLKFFQDWSGTYKNQENVALVPAIRNNHNEWETEGAWGMYWLESWRAKQ